MAPSSSLYSFKALPTMVSVFPRHWALSTSYHTCDKSSVIFCTTCLTQRQRHSIWSDWIVHVNINKVTTLRTVAHKPIDKKRGLRETNNHRNSGWESTGRGSQWLHHTFNNRMRYRQGNKVRNLIIPRQNTDTHLVDWAIFNHYATIAVDLRAQSDEKWTAIKFSLGHQPLACSSNVKSIFPQDVWKFEGC